MDGVDRAQTTAMTIDADADADKKALTVFWANYRLQHVEQSLREYLGTETLSDLDDVYPGDLHTLHAVHWAQTHLNVAEINRLLRAVQTYHAAKHPSPKQGVEHLPRCRACICQNNITETIDAH